MQWTRLSFFVVLVFIPCVAWPQGNPVGPEFRINTYTTNGQGTGTGSVAADSSGNFVVVWGGAGTGDPSGAFGQRYANSGTPLGPEFRVNTYTTDLTYGLAVASDPLGNFVVVWSKGDVLHGWECLRPALRQLRHAARPGVPRQHVHPQRPR
jgi:hypothetical protein